MRNGPPLLGFPIGVMVYGQFSKEIDGERGGMVGFKVKERARIVYLDVPLIFNALHTHGS